MTNIEISKECYLAADFLALEQERLFANVWLMAGRTDQLKNSGDYFTFEIGIESILVVNAGKEGLQAFYNVCRHRGRRVVNEGECGNKKSLLCPYHYWSYDLCGALRGVPSFNTFDNLNKADNGLIPVKVDTWQDLVFINMNLAADPLADYLAELKECLEQSFAPSTLVMDRSFEFPVNWKVGLEAFIETYHVAFLHPDYAKASELEETKVACFQHHSISATPSIKANNWPERSKLGWRDWIADRYYMEYYCTLFPNVSVHVLIQGLTAAFRFRPHALDPQKMVMDIWLYQNRSHKKTTAILKAIENGEIPEILAQDFVNFEHVQKGLRSRSFQGPNLNYFESRIAHFHQVLRSYLDK